MSATSLRLWITASVLLALATSRLASAQDQPPGESSPAAEPPKVHTVERGELVLKVEREGRIDSAEKSKVRLIPKHFNGPFEVTEVLHRSGRVKKGDVLLRLNNEPLEKAIESAAMTLDHAQRKLKIAQDEQRILREANATRIEQAQKNRIKAETEQTIWDKYDGPGMLKSADLSLRQREFSLADQKQELAQLESMYSGTHLATETKDIVLDRARRGVMMSEEWMVLSKNSDVVTREHRYPMQDRNVKDTLKWASQDEAHAAVNVAAGEQRKGMELETAQRAVRDAEETLAKLRADQALMDVKAPADGVMTRIELEPHDTVNARSTICEVLNPAELLVKFSLTAEDLRVLGNGGSSSPANITLQLVEFPDIKVTGTIEELAEIGAAADKATHFPLTVSLTSSDPMVRIGMRCKLFASRAIPDALKLPAKLVKWEDGQAWCTVQTAEGAKKRPIVVGPASGDEVAVIEGLAAGDQVVLEEAGGK